MTDIRSTRVPGIVIIFGSLMAACGTDHAAPLDPTTNALSAANDHTVLILSPTVTGGAGSREAVFASAAGYTVEVVDAGGWLAKTAADFASYRAIILGDATCSTNLAVVSAAQNSRTVWGPKINGNVILVGTDPVFHRSQGGDSVTRGAVQFAAAETGTTGAYISLSCYYAGFPLNTPVPLLEPFESLATGSFTVRGVNCANKAHKVANHPALAGITDTTISNWNCSVHEGFDHFPNDFLPLAIARDVGGAGTVSFPDGSSGVPYIMARGRTLIPVSCGNAVVEIT